MDGNTTMGYNKKTRLLNEKYKSDLLKLES